MPPLERARRLSHSLQAHFRIDLFSALVERDFERRLAETILEAERDAYRRGRNDALAVARTPPDASHGRGGAAAGDSPAATPRRGTAEAEPTPMPAWSDGLSKAM